jgi:hypothetical protein
VLPIALDVHDTAPRTSALTSRTPSDETKCDTQNGSSFVRPLSRYGCAPFPTEASGPPPGAERPDCLLPQG